jgi:hypothetical protein
MLRLQPSSYRLDVHGYPNLWKADNGRLLWVKFGIDCPSGDVAMRYPKPGGFLGESYVHVAIGKIDPIRPPPELWVTADEYILDTYRTVGVIAEDGLREMSPVVMLERLTLAEPPP